MFRKISQMVRSFSIFMLNMQGQFLQKRLVKRLGYTPKKIIEGCTVDISQAEKDKRAKVDTEVRGLLKQLNNDVEKVSEYLEKHNVPIYRVKFAKKVLNKIGEEDGFISERTGLRALFINLITGQGIKFKTGSIIVTEDEEPDIYNFIHYLHKWYAKNEGMEGFDEKSQRLLQKFNIAGNQESLVNRLSLPQIEGLKQAIARDVQSIEFVSQYSKENAGAKKALEKMKEDGGANI